MVFIFLLGDYMIQIVIDLSDKRFDELADLKESLGKDYELMTYNEFVALLLNWKLDQLVHHGK